MSGSHETGRVAALLERLHALTDELLTLDLGRDTDAEFVDAYRSLERLRRRLPAVEHRFVHDTQRRGLPAGYSSTGQYLAGLLHPGCSRCPRPSSGRGQPARSHRPDRRTPSGTVRSCRRGAGERRLVVRARPDHRPDRVRSARTSAGSARPGGRGTLTGYAARLSPWDTAICGQRIHAHLNPDGREPDEQQKHREFSLHLRPDGTGRAAGEFTAECAEIFATVLESLSAPQPASDGTPDPRTATQRRHDALLALTDMALLSGGLPRVGGITTSVVLTMTTQDYLTGRGLATTGHGNLVRVQDALGWITGDSQLLLIALNSMHEITHYSSVHRCHTEQQRLTIIARDQHCTGPGCNAPIAYCQVHHVPDYAISRRTRVDEGVLACTWHHRELINGGWSTRIADSRVEWIPPPHIDAEQRPRFGNRQLSRL